MPPGSIESVKKNIFNQNMFLPPKPFLNRIDPKLKLGTDSFTLEQQVADKAAETWLTVIANDNNMTYDQLIQKIFMVMTLSD